MASIRRAFASNVPKSERLRRLRCARPYSMDCLRVMGLAFIESPCITALVVETRADNSQSQESRVDSRESKRKEIAGALPSNRKLWAEYRLHQIPPVIQIKPLSNKA